MSFGDILVGLALLAALLSAGLSLGALRGQKPTGAAWAFGGHAVLLVAALVLLGVLFVTHRFEYVYVSQYSSRSLSPALTLAALWAGQEGSFLLWAVLGALVGLAMLRQPGRLTAPALFFVSLAQVAIVTLLAVKSPFVHTAMAPPDGRGLNPLLEDPWMIIHPPVLFLGYAGLLIPFALAAAALVRSDWHEWNRMVWPWTLFGVLSLGAGIALGGIWAYKVLGWGGYWGWDPVENASLVPWLVAVALLHGLLIQRTTRAMTRVNLLLASLGWVTVLGGTYLTRSGVLADFSVHSFADSGLNLPMQVILAVFTAIPLALLAPRWKAIAQQPASPETVSRESALWLGMITVLVLAGLVTVGTTAPLLTSLFGKPASVRPDFYNQVTLPLGIALVVLMGLSPALRWYRQAGLTWLAGLWPGLLGAAAVLGPSVFAGVHDPGHLVLIGVCGVALGVNVSVAFKLFRRGWMYGAGYLGHVGVAVMVLGIALSTSLGKAEKLQIAEGQTVQSLGYGVTYRGLQSDGRAGRTLDLVLEKPNFRFEAKPALLPSPQSEGIIRKPAIHGRRELYLSPLEVREMSGEQSATWLNRDEPAEVGGARYTFKGFRMESQPEFRVHADLEVTRDGRTFAISPAVAAGQGGSKRVDAEVPGLGMVSVVRIDADHRRVALSLPTAASALTLAVVELSTKPFINLVWVGVLLTFIGTSLAGIRRAAEKTPARAAASGATKPAGEGPSPVSSKQEVSSMRPNASSTAAPGAGTSHPAVGMLLAFAVLSILGTPARGAETPSTSAFSDTTRPVVFLKEMVVTGARYPRAYYESPQALSFVSRVQLREQAPIVVGDVLTQLPGVDNSKDSPWEQRPVLRGLSGQRVLVLMDGNPMNSARGNGPHPSMVDAAQIERIEVVRGPSSVAYGSDALGGVINIITRQSQAATGGRGLRGSASLGGSSAESQGNGYLELRPQIGRLSAILSGGVRNAGDFESPHGKVPNSAFDSYNALADLRYDVTERLALKAGYQQSRGSDIGIPGLDLVEPGFEQHFDFAFYNRDFAHLALDHAYPGSPWLASTHVNLYWQREHRDFYSEERLDRSLFPAFGLPPAGPGAPPSNAASRLTKQDRYFDLDSWGFQTQMTSGKTDHFRFSAGIDAVQDQTDGDNIRQRSYIDSSGAQIGATSMQVTASVPDGRFGNYGTFLQGEYFASPQWTVSAGGRFTHYRYRTDYGLLRPGFYYEPLELDDNALSGSLGAVFAPIPDLHLSANVANGYRQPNAQDLFFSGPASVGYVLGNPDLKPEKSVSYDVGMRWGPGDLALSGNAFYSTYEDLISAVPLSPPYPPEVTASGMQSAYQYTNIASATIWGGEAEAEWRFLPQWSARTSLSGTVGNITSRDAIQAIYGIDADHVPLEQVPPFKGNAALRWSGPAGRYWIEAGTRYSWRTNRLPPPVPGVGQLSTFKSEWIVGDLFAGARISGGGRALIGVRNITDTPYQPALASVEDPGISLVASLSYEF